METNNILYDFEQVSEMIGCDRKTIEDALVIHGFWFRDEKEGFLFNPIANVSYKLFIKEHKKIYFTSQGIERTKEAVIHTKELKEIND